MMKYINPKYARSLLGNKFPLGVGKIVSLLDRFLNQLDDDGDKLPSELLFHNISQKRDASISEFAKLDADIVIESDNINKKLSIDLRDYRKFTQFTRNENEKRVVLHIVLKEANKTTWAIHIPLQSLMIGFGDPKVGYQCYAHGISFFDENNMPIDKELFYCGITSRSWLTRMAEHFREIKKESNKLFHRKWRQYQGQLNVLLNSELIALNHSYEGAMNWEEWIVDRYMENGTSLNMIPGGFKGLKVLYKSGYLKVRKIDDIEVRDKAVLKYSMKIKKSGMPNPFIGSLWDDDNYYKRVIGKRKNTFSANEVESIRKLKEEGFEVVQIAKRLGIANPNRIKNILIGKTYSRM